jgi:hypothetical protein
MRMETRVKQSVAGSRRLCFATDTPPQRLDMLERKTKRRVIVSVFWCGEILASGSTFYLIDECTVVVRRVLFGLWRSRNCLRTIGRPRASTRRSRSHPTLGVAHTDKHRCAIPAERNPDPAGFR